MILFKRSLAYHREHHFVLSVGRPFFLLVSMLLLSLSFSCNDKKSDPKPPELQQPDHASVDGQFEKRDGASFVAQSLDIKRLTEDEELELFFQSRLLGRSQAAGCKFASTISVLPPRNRVVLTFDDGPDAELTPMILDILRANQIKATFFVTGENAAKNPGLLRRMQKEGHLVGSHSWNHPNFHQLTKVKAQEQIRSTEREIKNYMGSQKYFRYPYGSSTCDTNQFLRKNKYGFVGWHVDSCDWAYNKTGTVSEKFGNICGVKPQFRSQFVEHVLDTVRESSGGIILFHDAGKKRTLPQVDRIIKQLKALGYSFTNLNDPSFKTSIWW